ncbi:hypothetical protein RN001_008973 [Aquatica leii]|uniref:Putative nuclease HARBI1 n=1 Tax=Aquatica leii TaxID=1421715 RepID=A0AAN7PAA7_9COLE|nr:hypothetical protein RN001_008973 [Aquatica leii]
MGEDNSNNILLNNIIQEDLEDAAGEVEIRRDVLPQTNPFDLSDHKFVKLFRVSKHLFQEIVDLVTHMLHIQQESLRFYASGSYQEITGSNSFVAISQSSIRSFFYMKYRFPGAVGCIDYTHISVVAPQENEHLYVNRKGYHSLNVQLICDTNLKILNCNARFPGATHDAYIWRQFPILWKICTEEILGIYPTRPWLLTPLENTQNAGDQRYNEQFCSIRSTIERCNGVFKSRFRCLIRHRTLHYDPVMAGKIINACCVLHNLCINNNIPEVDEPHGVQEPDYGKYAAENYVDNIQRVVHPDLAVARQIQRNIINHFI